MTTKKECSRVIPSALLDKVDEKLAILELAAEGAAHLIEQNIDGDHRFHIGLFHAVHDLSEAYRKARECNAR